MNGLDGKFTFPPLVVRFWEKVEKTETCWNWVGKREKHGYGRIRIGAFSFMAHQVSYYLKTGEWIPVGYEADHTCKNPSCIRWAYGHLEAVTHEEHARRTALTHPNLSIEVCPWGHDYSIFGVVRKTGSRFCNRCNSLRQTARRLGMSYPDFMVQCQGVVRTRDITR